MGRRELRFRDSCLIRIGMGIIAVIVAATVIASVALHFFRLNPEVGPTGLWALMGVFFAFVLVLVGIGQTVVRRRRSED